MITTTLSMWGNGAVTIPKEWRKQLGTTHFLAKITPGGVLLKPIVDDEKDVEYYERGDGSFGLHFPHGMEMGEFLKRWDAAARKIKKEDARKKAIRKRSR